MRAGAMMVAAVLVAGCAGSAGEVGDSRGGALMDDVAATMEVKLQGDSVRLLLHVTNTGEDPLEFTFPSSQRYDFVVRDGSGEEVWRWSDGMAFAQAISHATLEPGETWDFDVVWEPGSRTGHYEVVGRVTATEHDLQQSAAFELP